MKPCLECGAPSDHEHHIVPLSKGGTKTVPLCAKCHSLIHDHGICTRELTRQGLARAKARGIVLGGDPLGLRRAGPDRREHVPEEARTVARILALHSAGLSLREIARAADGEGLTTKQGGRWHPATVARVLRRAAPAEKEKAA